MPTDRVSIRASLTCKKVCSKFEPQSYVIFQCSALTTRLLVGVPNRVPKVPQLVAVLPRDHRRYHQPQNIVSGRFALVCPLMWFSGDVLLYSQFLLKLTLLRSLYLNSQDNALGLSCHSRLSDIHNCPTHSLRILCSY